METMKFKTNIKCSGCVAAVTPFLNDAVGDENWRVDTNDPAKVLTVVNNHDKDKVIHVLKKAGYQAESI